MDKQVSVAPRVRVAAIGASYVGALANAVRDYPAEHWGCEFGMFVAGWIKFNNIEIVNGRITGFLHSSGLPSVLVENYEAFVIYGDLLTPHHVNRLEEAMAREKFSVQLRRTVLEDVVAECHSMVLARSLRELTDAPIFMLSRNVVLSDEPVTQKQYEEGVALLRALSRPAIYLAQPEILMAEGYITDAAHHRFLPQPADSDLPLQRDEAHMNPEAGRVVLRHIIAAIQQRLAECGAVP